MWYGLLILGICGVVLMFLAQLRLWCAAAFLGESGQLVKGRPFWLLWLPAFFLSAAMLIGLAVYSRLRKQAAPDPEEVPQLYVLLDCSVSMTAEAWQGSSRLDVAKKLLRSLPSVLGGRELALVTFAGEPFLDFPPSSDRRGWLDALEAVSPERLPLSGSAPGRGLQLLAETAELCSSGNAVILLLSDGEINVENPELEAVAWRQRDLPCLFLLMGAPGINKDIPEFSGGRTAADDQELGRLLGLSSSPFACLRGQAEANDPSGLSERLQRLIWEKSGKRAAAESRGGVATQWLLLLSAACAMLAVFSSRYGLPKIKISLLLLVVSVMPMYLRAGEAAAIELCREAWGQGEHPEDLQKAVELYRRALRLQPGLPLAARNLEYTLRQLQQQKLAISRQKKENPEAELSAGGRQRESVQKVPVIPGEATGSTSQMTADEETEQAGGAVSGNDNTWRELKLHRRKIFRTPPKCNLW